MFDAGFEVTGIQNTINCFVSSVAPKQMALVRQFNGGEIVDGTERESHSEVGELHRSDVILFRLLYSLQDGLRCSSMRL